MSGAISVFTRELKLAWSGGGGAALPVGFFFAAGSLTPFAVGNDSGNLQIAGPGVMWIALALSSLLPMERLFQADLEDGTLDAYAGSGIGMEGIALAKTLALGDRLAVTRVAAMAACTQTRAPITAGKAARRRDASPTSSNG